MAMLYKSSKQIQTFKPTLHLLNHDPHGRVSVSEKLGNICSKIEEARGTDLRDFLLNMFSQLVKLSGP